jgi:hypothetical protein
MKQGRPTLESRKVQGMSMAGRVPSYSRFPVPHDDWILSLVAAVLVSRAQTSSHTFG